MDFLSMDHGIDLEAQQVPPHSLQVVESGSRETRIPQARDTSRTSPLSSVQQVSPEIHSVISQDEGHVEGEVHEMNILQSDSDPQNVTQHTPTQGGENQVGAQDSSDQPVTTGPCDGTSDGEPEDKPMTGDFDSNANAFWTLYGKEAKSHDEAQIQTLKEDMDGVLIFAGLFSAALTAFTIDSRQSLKPNPSDQIVYYLQQNVAMLDQISRQIVSIAPQISIPSTAPAPFPAFKPLASDIWINVFWFMALIFSLTAALLATLVQQWVHDYMHVFQQYSDPLKSARLRQYLFEGSEGWYMPVVAEAVPGLLHISLFLFFVGLGDSVLNINTTVGLSTTIPIGMTGLVYILIMIAPIIYPQSPYQNSFSGLIWYLFQTLYGRQYKDRGSKGVLKSVSSNMAQGQMQLAMEESEERKCRDGRAIRWLIGNMTEDAEMESFVMAIPGSFTTEWGVEVWKKISSGIEDRSKSRTRNELVGGPMTDTDVPTMNSLVNRPSRISIVWNVFSRIIHRVRIRAGTNSSTPINTLAPFPMSRLSNAPPDPDIGGLQGEVVVQELSARICQLLDKCKHENLFASKELWRRQIRVCIESTASLICCANAKLDWFGGPVDLLRELACDEFGEDMDELLDNYRCKTRWSCLSFILLRSILERKENLQELASSAARLLETEDDTGRTVAQKFEKAFETAWRCLTVLSEELSRLQKPSEQQVMAILLRHESEISQLELINIEADSFDPVDLVVKAITKGIYYSYGVGRIMDQMLGFNSGSLFGFYNYTDNHYLTGTKPLLSSKIATSTLRFIPPRRFLKSICSIVPTFRNILEGHWDVDVYKDMLEEMKGFLFGSRSWRDDFQSQLWRFQDLNEGGGLGYSIDLFFHALWDLSYEYSLADTQDPIYVCTFRAITADWSNYKNSIGTQNLFLSMATSDSYDMNFDFYPQEIIDEFFLLLSNILEGQTGPHIDDAMRKLSSLRNTPYSLDSVSREFYAKALEVITQARA